MKASSTGRSEGGAKIFGDIERELYERAIAQYERDFRVSAS